MKQKALVVPDHPALPNVECLVVELILAGPQEFQLLLQ